MTDETGLGPSLVGEEATHQPLVETADPLAAPGPSHAEIIETWFSDHFHNNWVAQNTELFNKLHEAKQDLVERFKNIKEGI